VYRGPTKVETITVNVHLKKKKIGLMKYQRAPQTRIQDATCLLDYETPALFSWWLFYRLIKIDVRVNMITPKPFVRDFLDAIASPTPRSLMN
jgi:hypothetical protein